MVDMLALQVSLAQNVCFIGFQPITSLRTVWSGNWSISVY
jgi:hypothetical protein